LRDDTLAAALRQGELGSFLSNWCLQPMWAQLRASPRYPAMLQQRHSSSDARGLAAVLAAASPGRAPSLWQELPAAAAPGTLPPLLLVAGQSDAKFVGVAEKLTAQLVPAGGSVDVRLVPACGHAVHIERPLELLTALQQFSDAVPATHRSQGASTGALLGQNQ
jgi:isochorismate synthase/2-succinyl-5-enolpyruvyl-6-hydroxy-3-cyclohexene-1-carboxylate synthase/2-succinyl-6-hydroxy-2,4-cyclohexadiene-1-carboxylate synthase/O-succinylbenzoate synthase